MTAAEHTGARIRMYRKNRRMTLEQLAKKIHKTTSAVAKYETGAISVDINTLAEIAEALSVRMSQLVDYPKNDEGRKKVSTNAHFFNRHSLFYAYYYFGIEKKVYTIVLEPHPMPEDEEGIIAYIDVNDVKQYSNANYIYHGKLKLFESTAVLLLKNSRHESDYSFCYIKSPFYTKQFTYGIVTHMSAALRIPCTSKILFSQEPIEITEEFTKSLSIADKETLADIKRTNFLFLY